VTSGVLENTKGHAEWKALYFVTVKKLDSGGWEEINCLLQGLGT